MAITATKTRAGNGNGFDFESPNDFSNGQYGGLAGTESVHVLRFGRIFRID
jgi:hypothetical protein